MSGDDAATWRAVFVLPNVELTDAIEGGLAALAPPGDPRVLALKQVQPTLRQFLTRFVDAFGQAFEPAVLLVRANAPAAIYEIGALASFRDLIALSAICAGRAEELKNPRGHRMVFGNAFAFYPWMVDRHDEDLIGRTPALLGVHDVRSFRGQSSPELFRTQLTESSLDLPLFKALLARWRRRYDTDSPAWPEVALLRSLNMAYHASLMPAASDVTFYDIGRLISLWVSAFEILAHPGGSGIANRDKVFDLLEQTSWERSACADPAYDTGGKTKVKRTLASWLYQALNDRRNDFLHGNPVARESLILPASGRNLFEYAAPLYRIALTAFLRLIDETPLPPSTEPRALGEAIARRIEFADPQRSAEDALITAVLTPEDIERRRPGSRRTRPSNASAGQATSDSS